MIAVCGSGSWGTALATVLARNSSDDIWMWGREEAVIAEISTQHTNNAYLPEIALPHNIKGTTDLKLALSKARDILIAIPSKAFPEILSTLKPLLKPEQRIVWATKGLEPGRGRFLDQVLIEQLGPQQVFAILSGPSFAAEVARNLPTAVTIASKDQQFSQDLLAAFHAENFRVYLSTDIIGVQVGGVIKNILAVAAGVCDGLGFGANARAALITRGVAEMLRFGKVLGAQTETLLGLAGIGDVILTCTDDQSRNRRFGLAIAKGSDIKVAQEQIGQIVEAAHNTAEVCKIAAQHKIEMPIAEQVHKVLTGEVTPRQAVSNLLTRKPAYE